MFASVLAVDNAYSLEHSDCFDGNSSVTPLEDLGLNMSEGLVFISDGSRETFENTAFICLDINGDFTEIGLKVDETEEECEYFGWCSQYRDEERCSQACHILTKQKCRYDNDNTLLKNSNVNVIGKLY